MMAFIRMLVSGEVGDLHVVPVPAVTQSALPPITGNRQSTRVDSGRLRDCFLLRSRRGCYLVAHFHFRQHHDQLPVSAQGPVALPPLPKAISLYISMYFEKYGIWQLDYKVSSVYEAYLHPLIPAKGLNGHPEQLPRWRKKIAFESDRLGYSEIWVCDSDGCRCRR